MNSIIPFLPDILPPLLPDYSHTPGAMTIPSLRLSRCPGDGRGYFMKTFPPGRLFNIGGQVLRPSALTGPCVPGSSSFLNFRASTLEYIRISNQYQRSNRDHGRNELFPSSDFEHGSGTLLMSRNVPRGQATVLADFRCPSPGRVRKSNGGESYKGEARAAEQ
jgi:hypothetical protein